jgi:death-on-curing protein
VQKAAVLLDGLATTQGFWDGNKRTAWIASVTYLRLHGLQLIAAADEYAADMVLDLVEHQIEMVDVQEWLLNHIDDHGQPC